MSTKNKIVGRHIGLLVIKLTYRARLYWTSVLPEALRTLGYSTRIEDIRSITKVRPKPIIMLVRYIANDSLATPDAIGDLWGPCKITPPENPSAYKPIINKKTSRKKFLGEILPQGIWAPMTLRELEIAIHILGLQKRVCQPS